MFAYAGVRAAFSESCSLGWERKLGGTFHLKLNTISSPIANKYREGKVQSTLERELNVPETVVMQAYGTCAWLEDGKSQPSVCWVVGECLPRRAVQVEDASLHPLAVVNTGSCSVKRLSSLKLRL